MESEIARRKEHKNYATNFEQARGFVRTNWKTKNYNPDDDFMVEDTSSDESENEKDADESAQRSSAMTNKQMNF